MKQIKEDILLSEMYSQIGQSNSVAPVKGKYLYFTDGNELYQLNPYKLMNTDTEILTLARRWERATVIQGEDLRDMGGGEKVDPAQWYVAPSSAPSDHTSEVYVGS